ncbi:PQQ-binding-like beta-propeller repeat protein [Micromonosporaceae bacterium B7E4]
MAVIDLGEERYDAPADPVPPRRLRRRRLRTTALVLAGALVLGAGGAAPPVAPLLTELYRAPLDAGGDFTVAGDRLFVTEPLDGGGHRVSGYDLGRGRQLWSGTYRIEQQVGLYPHDGLLMVVEQGRPQNRPFHTVVLDAATGQLRVSVQSPLTVLPEERVALVVEEIFPPGSRVDPDNPPPVTTPIYHASRGSGMYTAPSLGETGRVIDLDTGRDLWTSPLVAGIATVPAAAGRPTALLTGQRDGRLELRDVRTGAVRQRIDPAASPPRYAEVTGDSVLVRFESHVAVYSADLRQRRWFRAMPADQGSVNVCGPILCLTRQDPTGVEALDPLTGDAVWRITDQGWLTQHGIHLVEYGLDGTVRRAVDPHTGRTMLDLTGWTETSGYSSTAPLLLLRRTRSGERTWLGLLDPEGTTVRPLDPLPFVVSSCQVTTGALACRTQFGDLRAWRFRPQPTPAE